MSTIRSSIWYVSFCLTVSITVLLNCCIVPVSAVTLYTNFTFLNSSLSSFPFNETVRSTTLSSIVQLLDSYTFVDLALDSTNGVLPPLVNQTIPMQVDIIGSVNSLAQIPYENDVAFHEAVAARFYPLNDAHTRYVKPPPYSYSVFTLPFRVEAVNGSLSTPPTLVVRDAGMLLSAYEAIYGVLPYTRIANNSILTLLQINGKDAFTVLREYADSRIGYTKDAFSRFNLAVHGYGDANGYFFYRNQITFPRPHQENMTFTFQDVDPGGATVIQNFEMSWIGMYTPPNVTFAQDVHEAATKLSQQALAGNEAAEIITKHFERLARTERVDEFQREGLLQRRWTTELDFIREHATMHSALGATSSSPSASSVSASAPTSLLCPSPSLTVSPLSGSCYGNSYVAFLFPNSSVCLGILRVFSFSPTDEALFAYIVQSSLLAHSQQCGNRKQTPELIIDLRANGGGIISLGYALLRFLFPQLSQPSTATSQLSPVKLAAEKAHLDEKTPSMCYGRYDLRSSSVFQLLAYTADSLSNSPTGFSVVDCTSNNADFFAYCMWNDALSNTPWMDSNWMNSPRDFLRGGRLSAYSNPVRENCQPSFELWPIADSWQGYEPAHVTLISDGLCGSTCAVFSSFVQTLGFGKTVVYSAFLDSTTNGGAQQFWSFPGGQVDTLDEIVAMLAKWNLTSATTPPYQLLPNSASIRFAIREIYPWAMTFDVMPLEYVFYPAHFHYPYSHHFLNDEAIYAQVVKEVLPACVQTVPLNDCEVEHGSGVVPCVNGKLQTGSCKVVSCMAGYHAVPRAQGSAFDADCVMCPVGTWSLLNDVDLSLTSPLNTSCSACMNAPTEIDVTTVSSTGVTTIMTCAPTYYFSGWFDWECPYHTVCPASQLPPGNASGDDKKAAVVVLAVLLGLTGSMAIGLAWYVIRQNRVRTERESMGLLGQAHAQDSVTL